MQRLYSGKRAGQAKIRGISKFINARTITVMRNSKKEKFCPLYTRINYIYTYTCGAEN